jgi:hypothetical protein
MTEDLELDDQTIRARRMRRSALAHRILASVTKRQARLHRELALLLEKEAEAHVVLDGWARDGADRQSKKEKGSTLKRWGKEHLQQTAIAKREVAAHKDLAARSDARTLWHQTVATLLMRGSVTLEPDFGPEDFDVESLTEID